MGPDRPLPRRHGDLGVGDRARWRIANVVGGARRRDPDRRGCAVHHLAPHRVHATDRSRADRAAGHRSAARPCRPRAAAGLPAGVPGSATDVDYVAYIETALDAMEAYHWNTAAIDWDCRACGGTRRLARAIRPPVRRCRRIQDAIATFDSFGTRCLMRPEDVPARAGTPASGDRPARRSVRRGRVSRPARVGRRRPRRRPSATCWTGGPRWSRSRRRRPHAAGSSMFARQPSARIRRCSGSSGASSATVASSRSTPPWVTGGSR